jgi:hypothetical protein
MKMKRSRIAAISLGVAVACSVLGVAIPFLSDLLVQWVLEVGGPMSILGLAR